MNEVTKFDPFRGKRNTAGFDKHPENINRNGRPKTLKGMLKEAMDLEGSMMIPKERILAYHNDGSVLVEATGKELIVNTLLDWVRNDRVPAASLKAIEIVLKTLEEDFEEAIRPVIVRIGIDDDDDDDEEINESVLN